MRSGGDYAIVAQALIQRVRLARAAKRGIEDLGDDPIPPDGTRRAYILDSIRHPSEVELLRRIYQDAFVLIGVVCETKVRQDRTVQKYANAGAVDAAKFMARDARAVEKHGQRVSVHMADYFVENTTNRYLDEANHEPNPDWDINEKLSRLVKLTLPSKGTRL